MSQLLRITGRDSICEFRPVLTRGQRVDFDHWQCQLCVRYVRQPLRHTCPLTIEETSPVKAAYGFEPFMIAMTNPGTLFIAMHKKRGALCWLPDEIPYSWQPGIWRPQRIYTILDQETQRHTLRAVLTPGSEFAFGIPEHFTPYAPGRYAVKHPPFGAITGAALHRRPGGEIS